MADDKSIEIRITAKNLTEAELTKARQAIAGFARDTEGATGKTSGLGSALRNASSLAGAFGVTLGIAGVVKFGQALLDDADATTKLADKTGMTTTAVQQLKYIADQSGNTIDQLTGSISQMQRRIAGGDESALGALKSLGIELEDFNRMSPDEQFMAIAREVAKVEDPMKRVTLATDLMGKSGAEVLPSLIAEVDKLRADAPVMSKAAVAAFDSVGDGISDLWARTKNVVGEGLATMMSSYGRLAQGLKALFSGDVEAALTIFTDAAIEELPKVANAANIVHPPLKAIALNTKQVKDVEDQLEETRKKGIASAKKYADEQERVAKVLGGLGLVSEQTGLAELVALEDELRVATRISGEAMASAILALLPRLESLEERARRSGVEIKGLAGMLHQARTNAAHAGDAFAAWELSLPTDSIGDLIGATQTQSEQLDMQAVKARLLTDAYHHFGQQTPAELRAVAEAAERAYRTILESGTATPEQLREAWERMTEAQRAASGQLAADVTSDWRNRIFPSVTQTLGQLQTSVSGTFASMMLGAKGFKDGMIDIWGAVKSAAVRIFAEIADAWITGMLKRMIAALAGNKQAFAGGFASLIPGAGSGSSGSGVGGFASGFGSWGGGGSVPGASGSMIGPEMGSGTGALAGGGMNWGAGVGGGLAGAGIGFGVGSWVGGKTQSKAMGALAGAGSGALSGFMMGGPIGAAIGGVVGLIGGLIGGNKEYGQVKQSRAEFEGQFGGSAGMIEAVSKAYATLGRSGADAQRALKAVWDAKDVKSYERAVGVVQQALSDANVKLEKQATLREAIAATERDISALQSAKASWADIAALTEKYGIDVGKLGPKVQQIKISETATELLNVYNTITEAGGDAQGVLDGLADELSALAAESAKYGVELPENLKAGITALFEQGKLVDENGEKFKDLSGLKFGAPVVTEMDKVADALKLMTDRLEALIRELAGLETASIESSTAVRDHWRKAPWDDWANPEWPDLRGEGDSGGGTKGYAAGGLITSPHLAMVGEGHEPELIGPVGFMAEALAGALAMTGARRSSGERVVVENHNHVYLDGREVTEGIAPYLPSVVKRYGVARR